MSKIKLILGTYNTLPSGGAPLHLEPIYQQAFKPFLHAIYNHSNIPITLYYSGTLLEWLDKEHPEFHLVLNELTAKKSIEILGGAYWEPMLTLIPSSDRIGQVEMMTTYLRKKFGKRSRGVWISGQVWEPQLSTSLRSCGMDYVFLSEKVFPSLPNGGIQMPVVGEDQGKTVIIFPVFDSLAGQFLRVSPEKIIESLHDMIPIGQRDVVITLMLNGLALGGNGTGKICYGDKWLERFFRLLGDSNSWIECVHPRQYLKDSKAIMEKDYLTGPTYESLMEWALPEHRTKKTLPANRPHSSYRNFLSKYRESCLLYSKMMYVVILTNQVRSDKSRKKSAREELWKGQEHWAYWHNPSGGIYDGTLRHHAYSALIEAEKGTRERGIFKSALTSIDFDMDGEREFLYHGVNLNAYIHTIGGMIFELDYLPIARNYLATFARYEEGYHLPEVVAQGYDSYPRHAFMDHVFQGEPEEGAFRRNSPFPLIQYTPIEMVRDKPKVSFHASGPVEGIDDALQIEKTYEFHRSTLSVEYTLSNLTHRTLNFSWGSEINLAVSEEAEHRKIYLNTDSPGDIADADSGSEAQISSWVILDDERNVIIQLSLSEPSRLWWRPVFSDYKADGKMVHACQSSCFMPYWNLKIPPHNSWGLRVSMQIVRFKKSV